MHEEHYSKEFYGSLRTWSLQAASIVVPMVQNIFHARSVQDFGCGIGGWLSIFAKNGAEQLLGYDANTVDSKELLLPVGQVRQNCDLESITFSPEQCTDLAISIEVAEHLSHEVAPNFVRIICEAAPCVLFSAALPGQGGDRHINELYHSYWHELFAQRGYQCFDALRGHIWTDPRIAPCYRQNLFIYVCKKFLENNHELQVELHARSLYSKSGMVPIFEPLLKMYADAYSAMQRERERERERERGGIAARESHITGERR